MTTTTTTAAARDADGYGYGTGYAEHDDDAFAAHAAAGSNNDDSDDIVAAAAAAAAAASTASSAAAACTMEEEEKKEEGIERTAPPLTVESAPPLSQPPSSSSSPWSTTSTTTMKKVVLVDYNNDRVSASNNKDDEEATTAVPVAADETSVSKKEKEAPFPSSSSASLEVSSNGDDDDNDASSNTNGQTARTTTTAPATVASGWYQAYALLIKNLLTKYRSPGATFAEIFSPVLMMLMLVAGYQLSEVRNRSASTYDMWDVDLPGPWIELIRRGTEFVNENNGGEALARRELRKASSTLSIDGATAAADRSSFFRRWWDDDADDGRSGPQEWWRTSIDDVLGACGTTDHVVDDHRHGVDVDWDGELLDLDQEGSGQTTKTTVGWMHETKKRSLQQFDDDGLDDDDAEEEEEREPVDYSSGDVFDLFNDARRELDDILKSPLPIPTLTQYLAMSSALSSAIDPGDEFDRIVTSSEYGRQWGNLLTLGTLHLTPRSNPLTDDFVSYLNDVHGGDALDDVRIRIHDTMEDGLDFINDNLNERTWALVDFGESGDDRNESANATTTTEADALVDSDDFNYTIRMNYTTLPNTNQITDFVSIGLNRLYQRYYLSGFLTMQRTLNEFAFSRLRQDTDGDADEFAASRRRFCDMPSEGALGVWSLPMPTAAYSQNRFFQAVGFLLGLTIAMAFLYPTSRFIKLMVEDKESRMKETLAILGVRPWAYWLSWLITSLLTFFVITVLVTWTLSSFVLKFSAAAYLFALIGFFCTATIGFCFFVAAFFSRAKLAAIVGPIALFATLLPRWIFFGTNRYENTSGKMAASLLPCTAFAFAADIVADYEYAEQGVQEYNADEGEYSFNTALGFLVFDSLLYMVLGWYLEQIMPRQYGVPRKWYFVFLPRFWFGPDCCCGFVGLVARLRMGSDSGTSSSMNVDELDEAGVELEKVERGSRNFEPVLDPTLLPRVHIQNLVKRYNSRADVPSAVNNLTVTMYESQITCLLGHNGAGKTSTISVLTGLFPPTSGDCLIYGNSIRQNLNGARRSMGICPQHNVLFDNLTVLEHLRLFQRIKGIRPTVASVSEHAREVGLAEFFSTTSSALSGGNKRKLSVAIALCGEPQFLLLDEPTSGMDPYSRRATWELLRKKRIGRVTLLTTHFLDEAELLADRIAVMKKGKLQCVGAPLFLKSRFGLGYNLTLVVDGHDAPNAGIVSKDKDKDDAAISPLSSGSPDDAEKSAALRQNISGAGWSRDGAEQIEEISLFLREHIPQATLIRNSAREIMFRFPIGTEDAFPSMFDALEERREELGIGGYGVSNTTLEEVFLKLAEDEEECHQDGDELTQEQSTTMSRSTSTAKDPVRNNKELSAALPVTAVAVGTEEFSINESKPEHGTEAPSETTASKSTSPPSEDDRMRPPVASSTLTTPARSVEQPFEYMKWPSQIALLVRKRFIIQKRDMKGAFFMIILPVLLVSLVLLVLMLDISPAGDPIELTMDLYRSSPSGSSANTNVVVGGRASDPSAAENAMNMRLADLSEILREEYSHARFSHHPNATTSQLVSKFLLDTINDRDHDERYGAFVLDDSIRMALNVDWEQIRYYLNDVELQTEVLDLASDLVGDQGPFSFRLRVEEISDTLYSLTNLTADTLLNATLLRELVDPILVDVLTDPLIEALESCDNSTEANETAVLLDLLEAVNVTWDGCLPTEFDDEEFSEQLDSTLSGIFDTTNTNDVFDATDVSNNITDIVGDFLADVNSTAFNSTQAAREAAIDVAVSRVIDLAFDSVTEDGNIRLGNAFGLLSVLAGGDFDDLDGVLFVELSSVKVADERFVLTDVYVTTATDLVILDGINITSATLSEIIEFVETLLPNVDITYNITISSTASVLHNSSSPHAVAAFNQAYMEYMYKTCSNPKSRLTAINHPLPLTTQQSLEIRTILSIFASLFVLIPYCYIPAAFIVFLVKERVCKSKHLQLVSGVDMSAYWLSTYLWDATLYTALTLCIMVVFLMYGTESAQVFVGNPASFFCTFALTHGYGMSALPFAYLLSRSFKNHSNAQISVMGIFFVTGFVAVNSYFIMTSIESTEAVAEALRPLFRMWPAYNVGDGLIMLSSSFFEREILGRDSYPFDWDVCGKNVVLLYGLSLPYFVLLMLLEYADDGGSGGFLGRFLRWIKGVWDRALLRLHGVKKTRDGRLFLDDGLDVVQASDQSDINNEDEDVAREQLYVSENSDRLKMSASVLLAELWKIYPPSTGIFSSIIRFISRILCSCCCWCRRSEGKRLDRSRLPKRAVRGSNFAVTSGETFGLLGVNGAGKTTSLGILTGDISPTSGDAYVAGFDITGKTPGGVSQARKRIGFCPQVDPLLDLMTGRETLLMFGKLRGIPKDVLHREVDNLIDALTLTPHADKKSESYSGGNKRKLSLGVALIGNPKVLFIDEASSGMDPSARRKMWDLIAEAARFRSVILTTHSMEEAEALCSRVAIMISGRIRCLGSVQHLKSTHMNGYTVDLRCKGGTPTDVVDTMQRRVLDVALPGAKLAERHGRFLRFDVPTISGSLGGVFRALQEMKNDPQYAVESYSVSQCSLEQVFISLVKSDAEQHQEGTDFMVQLEEEV